MDYFDSVLLPASPGIFDWICNFRGRWASPGSRQAALGLIDEVDNVHKLAEQASKTNHSLESTPPSSLAWRGKSDD